MPLGLPGGWSPGISRRHGKCSTANGTRDNGSVRPDLASLAARLPLRPLTRFAPSPTYFLHLGHVVNVIYVWGVARALGGRVLLRIEDHDRARCRPEYERAILEDLEWLGVEPDIGSFASFRTGTSVWRQSDQTEIYDAFRRRLEAHHVYACGCSRKEIAAATEAQAGETPYAGTCRLRALSDGPGAGLRVEMPGGAETFVDALLGPQCQEPAAQCGDVLIRDRHGCWTYQFCAAADDWRHGVDLVIRGRDLLASTGRQMQLARMLGRPAPPIFLHHPIILRADGTKISKSHRDTGVRELREQGLSPADVLGCAAHACGLTEAFRPIAASDLAALFT